MNTSYIRQLQVENMDSSDGKALRSADRAQNDMNDGEEVMNETEMIAFWKANEKAYWLCPREAQEWLCRFDGPVQMVQEYGWADIAWTPGKEVQKKLTFRIPPDYKPAPVGGWVECEVIPYTDGQYKFIRPKEDCGLHTLLCAAPGMVGFGGVEYEHHGWMPTLRAMEFDEKLCKPLRVKFWVEG
jgi:hypothetical protein